MRTAKTPLAAVLAALALPACGCGGSGTTAASTGASAPTGAQTGTGATATSTGAATGSGLVAEGSRLYQSDGCSACHSLGGTRIVGPSWKGLAGSTVHLADGRTVTADDAYLTKHIVEPDAMTVQGYPGEVMAEAIEPLDLKAHPADVKALVAFIDSLR